MWTRINEKLMSVQVAGLKCFPEIEFNFSKWCKAWIKCKPSRCKLHLVLSARKGDPG